MQIFFVGPQVPWRAFKLIAESFGSQVSEDDVEVYRNMYTWVSSWDFI